MLLNNEFGENDDEVMDSSIGLKKRVKSIQSISNKAIRIQAFSKAKKEAANSDSLLLL